jgi:hypothetical protein
MPEIQGTSAGSPIKSAGEKIAGYLKTGYGKRSKTVQPGL